MDLAMLRVARPFLSLATTLGIVGCGASGSLTALDLDQIEQALGAPTGELEATDARGLAYALYNTRSVLEVASVASGALPGIDRSPLFQPTDLEGCQSEAPRGFEIDMPCLGHPTGKVRLQAQSELANDNGAYELTLARASVRTDLIVDGAFPMRVEGIANPVAIEKTTLAPTAVIDGMPRFFETLEQTGIVIDNSRGNEALYYVISVLEGSFVVQVDDNAAEGTLVYTVQDVKNLWSCTSMVSEHEITNSECRTPVGQGDFAELKF